MSGRLVSAVFNSDLPSWLKPYAAAYATFAAEDGSRVYPSIARVAKMVSKSERSTQRAIHVLRDRGVLVLEVGAGHHRAPRYQFRALALPQLGDPNQLPLFSTAGVQQSRQKSRESEVFNSHAQVLTRHPCHPMGDTHVTRSVSDPSFSTQLDKNARAQKTRTA